MSSEGQNCSPAPKNKVLLIGWDAADWNVALPLIEQGKMPALKRLIEGGAWGNLATIRPVLSPMLWTSISTGKRAWKHGIHGFSEPCPATGGIRPITNLSRKTKTIWNIVNQQGWQSNVVGWWPSHPTEPINGVMLSNHYQQAVKNLDDEWPLRPGTIHPKEKEEFYKEFRIHPAELGNEHILPFIPRAAEIDQEQDKRMETCAKVIAEVSGIHAAATACMQTEPWDFMAVYYDGIDHFGHGFMKYHPPRLNWVEEKDFELYKDVIESGYRYHDMMLDTLLQITGEDTTVMLISDHGFEPGNLRPKSLPNEPAGPAAEHSPYGIFCLKGPGIKQGERIHGASLLDITPTLLHLYGLPVGRDMDGKVLVNCFQEEQQVDFVDSWDQIAGEHSDGRHPAGEQLDAAESRESLKQLIDLGYIDEPDPDQGKAIDETIRELQYNLAQAYMDGTRYHDAAKILEKLWNRWPEESRFGTKLMACAFAEQDAAQARSTFDLQIERKKQAALDAQKELKALSEERASQEAARKSEAEARGEAYVAAELTRSQQMKLRRLQGQAGTNPQALAFLHGNVLALEGEYKAALECYEQAKAAQTANLPSLYTKIGDAQFELQQWGPAEKAYQQAIEIAPNSHEAHLGLSQVHIQTKNFFSAAASALSSLELIFHNPRAHLAYATALMHLGKYKLAEHSLYTALNQNRFYPAAHRLLGQLYEQFLKQPEQAAHFYDQAEAASEYIASEKVSRDNEAVALPDFPAIQPRLDRLNEQDDSPLIVVSGLPRSGTSLMMQMLAAAGIDIVSDQQRVADASNPKGYYEDARVKQLASKRDCSWLSEAQGKAIKIVAPLTGFIPEDIPQKIIFMERQCDEVITSQRTMLDRDGKMGASSEDISLARTYSAHLSRVNQLCQQRQQVELLPISYAETIQNPLKTATAVAAFIGIKTDPQVMATAVDPALYRVKK